ncbi:iron-sulfur cluster assembly scaffold protein [Pararhizobium sp. IMCC21322]|uniref:iron-sulfur cluster assembly scaffold protein n=1 Tax=Pararhizobium sp. IMCC21322 TaxID=3067903 RepID=UPI002740AC9D|nr:iron-sulfur cluster assembly scaffold protein [Pararhizobium sp. IMCC21322]
MIDEIYNAKILEFAGNIPRIGTLDAPDASAKAHSKLCGSTISVDLKVDAGQVTDFAQEVKACALGQSSASIVAANIVGATADELRSLKATMYAMMKEGAPPPEGRFEALKFLEPVRDYRARHASTLLVFDAVVDALDQIEADRKIKARA